MDRLEQCRQAKLRALGEVGPLVAASLVPRNTTCGNPHCKCARGEKHEGWCLTYKGKGNRTKTVHVSKDLVEEVRKWVLEHKRVKKLLREISHLSMKILKAYGPRKRAAARAAKRRPLSPR